MMNAHIVSHSICTHMCMNLPPIPLDSLQDNSLQRGIVKLTVLRQFYNIIWSCCKKSQLSHWGDRKCIRIRNTSGFIEIHMGKFWWIWTHPKHAKNRCDCISLSQIWTYPDRTSQKCTYTGLVLLGLMHNYLLCTLILGKQLYCALGTPMVWWCRMRQALPDLLCFCRLVLLL